MATYDPKRSAELRVLRAQEELDAAKRDFAHAHSQSPEHRLAEVIHSTTCHANHTDGCSWYYEISGRVPDWSRYAHARALAQALKILAVTDIETACAVITALYQ